MSLPSATEHVIVRVSEVALVSTRIKAVRLVAESGSPLPEWTAGAHIDALLPNGLERQYSLCGDPSDLSSYRIAVLHEPEGRGGSVYIHDELQQGDLLEIRPPSNRFDLEPAPAYRFIAGGVGITAILPMVAAAEAAGTDWTLDYLGRSTADMAFIDELSAYGAGRVRLLESSTSGRTSIESLVARPRPGELLYACGPGSLLEAIEQGATHWPASAVKFERFEARQDLLDAPTAGFTVTLTASGLDLVVPNDKSILDVVEAAGVPWPYSCREGTCGTCETRIVAGIADHRDSVLSVDEQDSNEYMMICVSRAKTSSLELEI